MQFTQTTLPLDWRDDQNARFKDEQGSKYNFTLMAGVWRASDYLAEGLLEDGDSTQADAYHNALEQVAGRILSQLDSTLHSHGGIEYGDGRRQNALYDTGYDQLDRMEKTGWWGNHKDFLGYTYAQAQETLE